MNIKFRLRRFFIKPIRFISRKKYQKAFCKVPRDSGVKIKEPWFISPDVFFDEVNLGMIHIGEGTVISRNCFFLVHDHSVDKAIHCCENTDKHYRLLRPVIIEDNCFIGIGCILLPGCHIGKNSIIGGGSLVKGRIPENVVAAGNPAKVICTIQEYYSKCKDNYSEYIQRY